MEVKATKELLHILAWLVRVDEIVRRGKEAYLGDCRVPAVMEALIPRKDESHGSTEEVSRGASGASDPDGGRSAA